MIFCVKTLKTCLISSLFAFFVAVFCVTETGLRLEVELGLAWLFKLRGPLPAPQDVIIISMDRRSAEKLQLRDDPEKWPRSLHATLIDNINRYNPALIAFNIHFGENRDEKNDLLLANAMQQRKNIVLSNYLKVLDSSAVGTDSAFRYEQVIDPFPLLAQSALAIAPFPVPKSVTTVKQFWTYRRSAGDIATFPLAAFECYLFAEAYPEILDVLHKSVPGLAAGLPDSYVRLVEQGSFQEKVQDIKYELIRAKVGLLQLQNFIETSPYGEDKKRLLLSWLNLLKGSESLFMNHYGKSGTITTIPFYQALKSNGLNPALFENKVVMVGSSEDIEPERNQGFYTVYSETGVDALSPIEIAATAVANLIDKSWIRPLSLQYQFFLILAWVIAMLSVCRRSSFKGSVAIIALMVMVYMSVAYSLFVLNYIWIPVFFPVWVLVPLSVILAFATQFLRRRNEHRNMYRAFSQYVPGDVVNTMTQQSSNASLHEYGQIVHGVCMATDAGKYTTLSERMDPLQLKELMNHYYATIFPQVQSRSGLISDVIGDAMLALWAKNHAEEQSRINACHAALNIVAVIQEFNRSSRLQLPTRIGLHFGKMHLGNVGALNHYEYRAVGDTVNTSTRIEILNKLLGTQILVSSDVIENLHLFVTRNVGHFILRGKTYPIGIHELIGDKESVDCHCFSLVAQFEEALELFQTLQWEAALRAFRHINEKHPHDGPTLFYISYLESQLVRLSEAAANDTTVIDVGKLTITLPS